MELDNAEMDLVTNATTTRAEKIHHPVSLSNMSCLEDDLSEAMGDLQMCEQGDYRDQLDN